ncbi:MAG: gliding motility-associated C-terminal domain-containing protein, partial [Bacteroidia bacterium]|nr:gliding motility-associated C-terminal domain-containing protein [Bacteroidia bacterium]
NNQYIWQFDSEIKSGQIFSRLADSAGIYKIQVSSLSSFGCRDTLTRNVTFFNLPVPVISLQQLGVNGSNLQILADDVTGIPVISRNWLTNIGFTGQDKTLLIEIGDTLTLNVSLTLVDSNGCTGNANISNFFTIPNLYFLPNVFTPNEDNLNETFKLEGFIKFKSFSMKIMNRWGVVVFDTNNPKVGWDGKYKGEYVVNDTYIYFIELEELDGDKVVKKGYILIKR